MSWELVYWAQALDNTAADHVELRGEQLRPEETQRRQEAASLIAGVTRTRRPPIIEGVVKLIYDGNRFVVEVPSREQDRVGRIAPLLCCGEHRVRSGENLGAAVASGLSGFARRIGRSMDPEQGASIRRAFDTIKKKRKRRSTGLAYLALIAVLAVVLLALVVTGR